MAEQKTMGRIKAKAYVNAVKIHGPNSPDVIEGRVPEGHREQVLVDHPEQLIELDYAQCVEMFGEEKAMELFKGVENG